MGDGDVEECSAVLVVENHQIRTLVRVVLVALDENVARLHSGDVSRLAKHLCIGQLDTIMSVDPLVAVWTLCHEMDAFGINESRVVFPAALALHAADFGKICSQSVTNHAAIAQGIHCKRGCFRDCREPRCSVFARRTVEVK